MNRRLRIYAKATERRGSGEKFVGTETVHKTKPFGLATPTGEMLLESKLPCAAVG
jgi:hypothetical protein